MKALRFETEPNLIDIPMPRPAHGEALIRVHTAGICNTDLEICNGYMGFQGILGWLTRPRNLQDVFAPRCR